MTTIALTSAEVDHALEAGGLSEHDPIRIAFTHDIRKSFRTSASPASILRSSLEVKSRIARERGKVLDGADELLVELAGFDDAPVVGVSTQTGHETMMVYLSGDSYAFIGAIRISSET